MRGKLDFNQIKRSVGKPRNFETPMELLECFVDYVNEQNDNPIEVEDWVGKDAFQVKRKKYVGITQQGFYAWLFVNKGIKSARDYFENRDGNYDEYSAIVEFIRNYKFSNNFMGASVGELSVNLIARELGLSESSKIDHTTAGQPINSMTKEEAIRLSKELDNDY